MSSRPPPMPSLAATHPALYKRHTDQRDSLTKSVEDRRKVDFDSISPAMIPIRKSASIAALPHEDSVLQPPPPRRTTAPALDKRRDSFYSNEPIPSMGEEKVLVTHFARTDSSSRGPLSTGPAQHPFVSVRSISADTAHLPLIPLEDPHLSEPRPKHLRCDTDLESASLVSPVFLTTLPFGSVIETANLYADERCEACKRYAMDTGPKCAVHGCEAGTQGYRPHAKLNLS
ncbi:hypothetical protein Slin14017_G056560 [Septoria linicola]|nr:hypothetical protein Slin14017_G056560 [Septoria linicola]